MSDAALSGSQLDKLGDRLRAGPLTLADLQQLRRFVETLEPFAEETFTKIRTIDLNRLALSLPPAVIRRNVKTIKSVVAKLRRQSIGLRQMQDIVGCRIVVDDCIDQKRYLAELRALFPSAEIVDRTKLPQHGYRAIHIIVREGSKRFEIQLRTRLQDRWANIVEKIADSLGIEIKYGGGSESVQKALGELSDVITGFESLEEFTEVRTSHGAPTPMRLLLFEDDIVVWNKDVLPDGIVFIVGRDDSPSQVKVAGVYGTFTSPAGVLLGYAYNIDFVGAVGAAKAFVEILKESLDIGLSIEDALDSLEDIAP
jgi:ppGpp synthetase/RelA/SpoT-type nucleotidyltranferase